MGLIAISPLGPNGGSPTVLSLIIGLIAGIFLGFAQWLFIRTRAKNGFLWLLGDVIGLPIGAVILIFLASIAHYDGSSPETVTNTVLIFVFAGAVAMAPVGLFQGVAAVIFKWGIWAAIAWAATCALAGIAGTLVYMLCSVLTSTSNNYTFLSFIASLLAVSLAVGTVTGLSLSLLLRNGSLLYERGN